jgi:hypothetical protein
MWRSAVAITKNDATTVASAEEVQIGSMPMDVLPIEPDGSRRSPEVIDLTDVEAQRCLDAQTQGMDVGLRFEGERLVCFGLRRGTVARDCAEIYEPSPVDGAGIVRLRRTGRVRVSDEMARALTYQTVEPPPILRDARIPDGRHVQCAGRRTRSTRRSLARAGPGDDDGPPDVATLIAAGNDPQQQSTNDITAAPTVDTGELHPEIAVIRADADGPATALDSTAQPKRVSQLAADDPRLPLLNLLADLIAEDILAGREVDR